MASQGNQTQEFIEILTQGNQIIDRVDLGVAMGFLPTHLDSE